MAYDAMRRGRAAVGVPVPPGGSMSRIAADDFHEGDGGDGIAGKRLAVSRGLGGDGGIHPLGDLREDVSVEEGFVQRSISRQVSSRRWR